MRLGDCTSEVGRKRNGGREKGDGYKEKGEMAKGERDGGREMGGDGCSENTGRLFAGMWGSGQKIRENAGGVFAGYITQNKIPGP